MPSSYRRDTPTIATFKKLTKRAYCPKLSGGYNRVSRGARRTLKLCASAVPPPSIAIFRAKLPLEILLFPKKPLAAPPGGGCTAINCVILEARSRVKKNEIKPTCQSGAGAEEARARRARANKVPHQNHMSRASTCPVTALPS